MNSKKNRAGLHKIALDNHITDDVAKLIVQTPFKFMVEIIEDLDVENLDKTNFYHRSFGRFYLKPQVLKYILKYRKENEERNEEECG